MGKVSAVLAVIFKAADDGVAGKLLDAVYTLAKLLLPLIADPAIQADLREIIANTETGPAQPEDPSMTRVADPSKHGGK